MNVIGTNIKNIRQKKNLSLKEVAKKCGVTEVFLNDIENGKKIPNAQLITTLTKVLGVNIDSIEPSYLSEYFDEGEETRKAVIEAPKHKESSQNKQSVTLTSEDNSISSAFSKAVRKIPVLNKITLGKPVPYSADIIDNKFEPIFGNKGNNVAGEEFIYYIIPDNSMSGTRILKNDLSLVFLTESINEKDILLFVYNNKIYTRKYKSIDDKKALLYPDNPDFEVIVADKKDIKIIGKIVRIEFKI